jgi:hypothetical protein
MVKVTRAYSLDMETIRLIEQHTNNGQNSRSRLVDNAIKWYLRGDIQELVEEVDVLKKIIADRKQVKESRSPNLSWWRRLLLGR